jgi:hypothetical protein
MQTPTVRQWSEQKERQKNRVGETPRSHAHTRTHADAHGPSVVRTEGAPENSVEETPPSHAHTRTHADAHGPSVVRTEGAPEE